LDGLNSIVQMKGRSFLRLILLAAVVAASTLAVDMDVVFRNSWPPRYTGFGSYVGPQVAAMGRMVFAANGGNNVEQVDFTDFARPKLQPSVAGVRVRCATIEGKTLFVTDDQPRLTAYDLTDPLSPKELGSTPLKSITVGMTIDHGFAYIASWDDGLQIVDVRDPANPISRGAIVLPERAARVAAANGFAYVSSYQSVHVVDATNPSAPTLVRSIGAVGDVAISGNLLFLAKTTAFEVYDLAQPSSPQLRGSLPFSSIDILSGVIAGEGGVYTFSYYSVFSMDVSNPEAPKVLGSYRIVDGNIRGMAQSGSEVYLTVGNRYDAVDMSAPGAPKLSGSHRLPQSLYSVALSGSVAFGIDVNGLPSGIEIIENSDILNPVRIGRLETTRRAFSIDVIGDYAYVLFNDSFATNNATGVIDVKDPRHPRMVTESFTTNLYSQFRKYGDYALALTPTRFAALDLSNPEAPRLVSQLPTVTPGRTLALDGTRAYVSFDDSFSIYDISNPLSLKLLGRFKTNSIPSIMTVAARGNVAYIGTYTNGLAMVDVSNPGAPRYLASFQPGSYVFGVQLFGDTGFAQGSLGGTMLDISDPLHPIEKLRSNLLGPVLNVRGSFIQQFWNGLATVEIIRGNPQKMTRAVLPGKWEDVAVSGRYAYVVSSQTNLSVVDISDSSFPQTVAELPLAAKRIAIRGRFLYAADPYFNIVDIADPIHPKVAATLPEPAQTVSISGDYAVTAGEGIHAALINITNAFRPVVTSHLQTGTAAIAASWPYVYFDGAGAYDISNPVAPVLTAYFYGFTTASEFDAVQRDGYIYSVGMVGLNICDLSNPAKPRWIGRENTITGRRVSVAGSFAYVVDYIGSLHVFDISDPFQPRRVGGTSNVNTLSDNQSWLARYGLFVSGDTVYLASRDSFTITDLFRYDPATLRVTSLAPNLPGTPRLRVSGPSGLTVQIERSLDFRSWTPARQINLNDIPQDFPDDGFVGVNSFYRATAK